MFPCFFLFVANIRVSSIRNKLFGWMGSLGRSPICCLRRVGYVRKTLCA
nr:MAG TPA: hypothetical protein [Bacteriophage sp.]